MKEIKDNVNNYTNAELVTALYLKFGVEVFMEYAYEKCEEKTDSMYDCFRTWAIAKLSN